jgi:uncharacterized membrane protein YkoI
MNKFWTISRSWTAIVMIALVIGITMSLMPQAGSGESPAVANKLSSKGEILSFEKISKLAKTHKPGEIIEVELEKKHGRYIYEVEILDSGSQVWELKLDAKTGQLLKMELDD